VPYSRRCLCDNISLDVAPEILENTRHRKYTRAVDVWSLGVVLYICLCGFPPFSDELNTRENPYTLAQQIKMGRFDYPSPYWDSVGDPALDLIDRMLTVDVEKRITIDECLQHPWVLDTPWNGINPADSTDGLTEGMNQLDFSRRKVQRERTLLSKINDVKVSKVIEIKDQKIGPHNQDDAPVKVKVWEKNPDGKNVKVNASRHHAQNGGKVKSSAPKTNDKQQKTPKEEHPAAHRKVDEFMEVGGKGDMQLFGDDAASRYLPEEVPAPSVNGNGS
jgi:serine/threonine-protein kinase CHEK2